MIEIKLIDGAPFVVVPDGRRDRLLTPQDATGEALTAISAAERRLRELAEAENDLHSKIQEALVAGELTADSRARMNLIRTEGAALRSQIDVHQATINGIREALTRIAAERIAAEHADHIARIVAPYDAALKEHTA